MIPEDDSLDPITLNAFNSLLVETVPTVNESLFVQRYLPLFVKREEGTPIYGWLDVAKHPYNSVDVIKDGKVLFRVPPLWKEVGFKNKGPVDSIGEILSLAEKKNALSPSLGRSFLEAALHDKIIHTPLDLETVTIWNDIFRRYNYPLIPLPEQLTQQTSDSKSITTSDSDGMVYEDF